MIWHKEVDAIVAGCGAAGLSAAAELAEIGLKVIVFEKQFSIEDTSTALSEGAFSFAGTDIQQREGVRDSDELLYKDLMDVGRQKNDVKLVQAYVENQLGTYHWLTGLGVEWAALEAAAGMSVPRAHVTDPLTMLELIKKTVERKGVELVFKTSVTGLITDESEMVIGVKTEGETGSRQIKAGKGVILATGGFGRDFKRLEAIDPRFSKVVPVVGLGHAGEGHRMAEKLGAYLIDLEYIKPTFGISANSSSNATFLVMFYNGAIIVNKSGKRFFDESASYKDIGKAALNQPDSMGYQIFDQKLYETGLEKAKDVRPEKAMFGLDEGRINLLVKGDTISELASNIGVPPEALQKTIETYNADAETGKDSDFGRMALAGRTGKIVKIDRPPFYAYASKGMLPGTYGGIVVDEDMCVLDSNGRIPGLYAAGEIVGGFHGASYMTGTAAGKALIFGRIAGRSLAKC